MVKPLELITTTKNQPKRTNDEINKDLKQVSLGLQKVLVLTKKYFKKNSNKNEDI